jgi:miniconductance mechanosensitive channel
MYRRIEQWLSALGVTGGALDAVSISVALVFLALVSFLSLFVARRGLIPILERAVHRSSNTWDDAFVANGFFRRLSMLLPVVFIYFSADLIFPLDSSIGEFVRRLAMTAFVLVSMRVLDAFLLSCHAIYQDLEIAEGKPVRGYLQAVKMVAYILASIFVISIMTDKSPWGVLTIFGGLTAVILLIFKDTILGFVASIQLAGNDMVRAGDWIEMPKHGADGDVIDVSIHTVKVRNWDKTITTIPTYKLVSEDFRNWRGMKESGGRRIKRSFNIDMNSICFCSDEMLARLGKIELLREYLRLKHEDIEADNRRRGADAAHILNGRRQTNLGIFRAYVAAYLRSHPKIHQGMTFLVRHLQPTSQGLPIEIYVFSSDQAWSNYESIQADIFDHILAAVPEFGLRLYQEPSGYDIRTLAGGGSLSG